MKLEVQWPLSPRDRHAVFFDAIAGGDAVAELGDPAIDRNPAIFDEAIGFAPRAEALLGEEFIDADVQDLA